MQSSRSVPIQYPYQYQHVTPPTPQVNNQFAVSSNSPVQSTRPSTSTSSFNIDKNLVSQLRQIYLPINVLTEFYRYAAKNTLSNIETCAILTGNIKNNALYITHVIIPKQSATSDTCVTQDEEKLIEIQATSNLLTLGW